MAILDDTRADWNARPPLRPLTRVPWPERVGVSWHWIGPGRGPSSGGPHAKCLEQVRDWQAQHQDPNGRIKGKDIGYNALICQHARAIEGRGLEFSGAHSPGVNWEHVGVQFMVGEDGDPPSTAMLARAVRLRADVGELGTNIRRDWGHRDDDEASTTCPGNWITNWVHRGGPTATQEDDLPTPREVSADLLDWDTIPADRIPFGTPRESVDLRTAVGYAMLWALEGRDASMQTLEITKALAAKGEALTAAEVEAAAERGSAKALDAKIANATTVLGVNR